MSGLLSLLGNPDEVKKRAIWSKGTIIPTRDPAEWRYDALFSIIRYSDYGHRSSEYGWELDHYPVPGLLGGVDSIDNLRPLHWRNNASHGAQLGMLSGLMGLGAKR